MARGWESKSVEAQQEERLRRLAADGRPEVDPAERARITEREALQLTRSRLATELGLVTRAERRQGLEAALADLDRRLEELRPVQPKSGGKPDAT